MSLKKIKNILNKTVMEDFIKSVKGLELFKNPYRSDLFKFTPDSRGDIIIRFVLNDWTGDLYYWTGDLLHQQAFQIFDISGSISGSFWINDKELYVVFSTDTLGNYFDYKNNDNIYELESIIDDSKKYKKWQNIINTEFKSEDMVRRLGNLKIVWE